MSQVHEEEDVVPAPLALKIVGAVLAIGVALCLVAWLVLRVRESQLRPSRQFLERELPAPHRVAEIREEPFVVLPPLPESEDDTALTSYGWVDKSQGIARIPIDRAMDLVVQGVRP